MDMLLRIRLSKWTLTFGAYAFGIYYQVSDLPSFSKAYKIIDNIFGNLRWDFGSDF